MPQMPLGFDLSFVDVDQISHGLEKVEGDARRQQDPQRKRMQSKPARVDHGVDLIDRGGAQFEHQKQTHQREDAPQQAASFCLFAVSLFQLQRKAVGEQGGKKQQQTVSHMEIHVKAIACKQQKNPPKSGRQDII